MFQLILQKKMLPLRNRRYCCEVIKERRGLNEVVVIGIRKEESKRRAKRKVFTNDCKLGCDKPLLSIILDWTTSDVFEFLVQENGSNRLHRLPDELQKSKERVTNVSQSPKSVREHDRKIT